jgi:hypothetical protein
MLQYTDSEYACGITKKSLPIIIESFKHGTRFVLPNSEFVTCSIEDSGKRNVFMARVAYSVGLTHFKVSNDERRRLLPILQSISLHLSLYPKNP